MSTKSYELGTEQGKNGTSIDESRKGNFIYTHKGIKFYPLDPRAGEMDIEDIGHALANSCRFTGHTSKFYSVAEHAVRMANEARHIGLGDDRAFIALMHDVSEAYIVDVPRPLKAEPYFGALYKKYEERIMGVVAQKWGFEWPMPDDIKNLDNRMLNTEQRDLMPEAANEHGMWFPEAGILKNRIVPWSPSVAKGSFFELFDQLS